MLIKTPKKVLQFPLGNKATITIAFVEKKLVFDFFKKSKSLAAMILSRVREEKCRVRTTLETCYILLVILIILHVNMSFGTLDNFKALIGLF